MSNVAKSYFGRGAKFNGVDQSVVIPNVPIENTVTIGCTITTDNAGYIVGESSSAFFILVSSSGVLKVTIGGTQYIFDKDFIGDVYDILVTITVSDITLYSNAEMHQTISRTESNTAWFDTIGINGTSSAYYSGILQNLFVISNTLTPTQIKYQYEHPERFLYREDDVLKSQILTQNEIDNVVAYLPLCETDGYVRDLVSYSETDCPVLSTNFGMGDAAGTSSINDTSITYEITTEGTQGYRPLITWGFGSSVTDAYYMVAFDLQVISGIVSLSGTSTNIGSGTGVNYGLPKYTTGTYTVTYIIKANGEDGTFRVRTDNRNLQSVVISNPIVKQLTGTYPIENYTTSVRDDAKNLPTGLQTSKWKRDLLGVPYGFTEVGIECDGSGYLDTGWVPELDTNAESIEFIMTEARSEQPWYNKLFSMTGASGSSTVEFYLGSSSKSAIRHRGVYASYVIDTAVHIILTCDNEYAYIYKDGELLKKGTKVAYSHTQAILLGRYSNQYPEAMNQVTNRLFKVHNKTMTPQEVKARFDRAVNAGLLN